MTIRINFLGPLPTERRAQEELEEALAWQEITAQERPKIQRKREGWYVTAVEAA